MSGSVHGGDGRRPRRGPAALLAVLVAAPWRSEARPVQSSTSAPAREEVVQILRRADEATRAVRGVRYRARARAEGSIAYDVSGEVVMEGKGGSGPERFNIELTGRIGDGAKEFELTFVSDGQKFWMLDRGARTLDEANDPSAFGPRFQAAMGLVLREFYLSDPFGDEINAVRVEGRGTRALGGVACDDVWVEYGPNRQALWSLGRDGLPRRVEREFRRRGGQVRMALEISGLEANPALETAEERR